MQTDRGHSSGSHQMADQTDHGERRAGAVRTAWILALIACVIFVAFILSGVLAS